jgi:undecaprenyl phosphate-alpha-L-ara4FN deformylase
LLRGNCDSIYSNYSSSSLLNQLALKIDVDTLRGTLEGVPRLVDLLQKHQANATFLFSLGPDHTGRAIKRVFRPGFLNKVSRTSVVDHYGYKTLMYGTLLPGPHIGKRCATIMRQVRDAGFEVGIHTYDHVKWQDNVIHENAAWTAREMHRAAIAFRDVFGEDSKTHGAAGWQMNVHALRLTQRMDFDYCSDGRGRAPFLPVYHGELIDCPQLPTTLPTLDELIGLDGINEWNVADKLLELTEAVAQAGHVYTLHAELEGMKLASVFDQLLRGWSRQGYRLGSVAALFRTLDRETLPHCEVVQGELPGRSGTMLLQGKSFLGPLQ